MRINIKVLGSSSAGNCTLIWDSNSAVMVDCGFGPTYIKQQLYNLGLDVDKISGVVITHTHRDHVNKYFMDNLSRAKVPVFCHYNIHKDLVKKFLDKSKKYHQGFINTYFDENLTIGNFRLKAFEVPHDSVGGCFGYTIYKTVDGIEKKISIATDMGYPDENLIENFIDSDIIIIESNHDPEMLENSGRPYFLIERIKQIGHLSNAQCGNFLIEILKRSKKIPQNIILAHISQHCNTNDISKKYIENCLSENGFGDVSVKMTYCSRPNETVRLDFT